MYILTKRAFIDTLFEPLCELPDGPKEIYVNGNHSSFQDLHYITIVGSRTCSSYAKEVVTKLISDLRGYPICIVSGLALGIDTLAHQTALQNNLPSIAFPGSGLDQSVIYPRSNYKLSQEIVRSGGLLVSEYRPDTKAAKWTFPKRNRLMAGLSDLTIIIEAREKSGTLITARLAMEYNKTVAVVPQNITCTHAQGSNKLMQDGAYPILSYKDILSLLHIPQRVEKIDIKKYSPEQTILLNLLDEPRSKDELYTKSTFEYQRFIELLSILELDGVLYERYGKVYKNTTQNNL